MSLHLLPSAARCIGLALSCAALLGGCATPPAETDSRFGDAVRVLNTQQTLDPAAARRNAGTPTRADGRSVRASVDQYVDSYRDTPPSSVVADVVGRGAGVR